MISILVIGALVQCALGGIVNPQENEIFAGRSTDGFDGAVKFFTDCQEKDLGTCLGVKAVTIMSRMARMEDLKLYDGISFVRSGEVDRTGRALSESELENSLPEETSQKRSRLIDLFVDATFRFLKSHSLQLRMPESTSMEIERALQEGRGKIKKSLMPILIGVGAKVFAVIPLLLGGLALIATKALILAKIAFVLAAIVGLQKLFGAGSGGFGGFGKVSGNSGWSSGGNYGNTGGWSGSGPYYRSFNENEGGQEMAYSAHTPKSV
ncbi:hypothetical protein RUM44_001752 [Polyplax serrata]|uniref:Osiris 6 n=1 Tax=Polyplax serrata TaxID=468196 RepID=A0ABR1AKY3_POLSC